MPSAFPASTGSRPPDAPGGALSRFAGSALRVALLIIIVLLYAGFKKYSGTPEFRIFYFSALALAIFQPWWALLGIAAFGSLSLQDAGKTHRLVATEALVIGAIVGELLRLVNQHFPPLRRGPREPDAPAPPDTLAPAPPRFPSLAAAMLVALLAGVLASALPGVQLLFAGSDIDPQNRRWNIVLSYIFFGYATDPTWGLRSVYNWLSGLLILWVACRQATPRRVVQLLGVAAAATVVTSIIGYGEFVGLYTLDKWRPPNPDLARLQSHRLMGLAGHSGWLAEWLLLTWPGLLAWWGGGRKRKAVVFAAGAIFLLTLLLTLQRAGWLGFAVAGGGAALYAIRRGVLTRRSIAALAALAAVSAAAALLVGGQPLVDRLQRLLLLKDRSNYSISALNFLRDQPLGMGIGMHYPRYESQFIPLHSFWQSDHVTSHNTWLHVAVEQGPFQAALLAAACVALALATRRGWRLADGRPDFKWAIFLPSLALIGIAVDSLAQYIAYIRVTEVQIWMTVGVLLGVLWRVPRAEPAAPAAAAAPLATGARRSIPRSLSALVVLLLTAAAAIPTALSHARRSAADPFPRPIFFEPDRQGYAVWTSRRWRLPLEADWAGVSFRLTATHIRQAVRIEAPGNPPQIVTIRPGESRDFTFPVPADSSAGPYAPLRWLRIECQHTWCPAVAVGGNDWRSLGIYVSDLKRLLPPGAAALPTPPGPGR